jgi:hypothetical protein
MRRTATAPAAKKRPYLTSSLKLKCKYLSSKEEDEEDSQGPNCQDPKAKAGT